MSEPLFDPSAPRKTTNLSVNADLLAQAHKLEINLSKALEEKLLELLRADRQKRWLEANAAAIQDANDFVAKHGVFSDGLREF